MKKKRNYVRRLTNLTRRKLLADWSDELNRVKITLLIPFLTPG